MTYLLLKAAHQAAMVVWMAGMIVTPVAFALRAGQPAFAALRRFDARVATPAMILTWLLGMTLLIRGGFGDAPWLWSKLVLVLALSALHGVHLGTLRRLERDPDAAIPAWLRHAGLISAVLAAAVILLAVTKPL